MLKNTMFKHKLKPNSIGTPSFAAPISSPAKITKRKSPVSSKKKVIGIPATVQASPIYIKIRGLEINDTFKSIDELTAFFRPYFNNDLVYKDKRISFNHDRWDGGNIDLYGVEKDIHDSIKTKKIGDTFDYNGNTYGIGKDGVNVLIINTKTFEVEASSDETIEDAFEILIQNS